MSLNTTTTAESIPCAMSGGLCLMSLLSLTIWHIPATEALYSCSPLKLPRALQVVVKWVRLPLSSLLHSLTKILKLCCLQPTLLLIPLYYRFSSLYMLSYILIYSHGRRVKSRPSDLTRVDSKSLFPQITKLIESYFKMNSLINNFYELLIQLQLKQDEERINWFN